MGCTVDQPQQRLKIPSNFNEWFAYYYGSKTPGMEPEVLSYTTSTEGSGFYNKLLLALRRLRA